MSRIAGSTQFCTRRFLAVKRNPLHGEALHFARRKGSHIFGAKPLSFAPHASGKRLDQVRAPHNRARGMREFTLLMAVGCQLSAYRFSHWLFAFSESGLHDGRLAES